MRQAVYSLCYHIVLETEGRRPMIVPSLAEGLHRFFERMVRQLGGVVVGFGGIPSHVHLLVRLPPTLMMSDTVRVLKKGSTRWASESRACVLVWGKGYGVFSVGKAQAPEVLALLERQESHHRRRSYAHEMLALMNGAIDVTAEDLKGNSIAACRARPATKNSTAEIPH